MHILPPKPMHILMPIAAMAALLASACTPPPDVPPPRFKPNPPYPPEIVDAYGTAPRYENEDSGYADPAPAPAPTPGRPGDYPLATPTPNPNEVISPYEPYHVIDIEGFRSGQLARDPSNNRIFRVP
jgi:hypothetical protein